MTTDQLYKLSLLEDLALHPVTAGIAEAAVRVDEAALLGTAARLAAGSARTPASKAVRSIFTSLRIGNGAAPAPRYFPARPLTIERDSFPQTQLSLPDPGLRTAFERDFRKIAGDDRGFAETLLHVLHKYAWALPSGHGDDVGLYDFAKSKAGLAVCLWRAAHDPLAPGETRDASSPVLLVGGGVSGIQDFLYDIASVNASKNLKGRSYYLHLLVDSLLRYVLRRLELFQGNIVVSSGGKFQLLVPHTAAAVSQLETLSRELGNYIFEKYATALSVEFEWTPVTIDELEAGAVGRALGRLNAKTTVAKQRKHLAQLRPPATNDGAIPSGYEYFFEPSERGGEAPRDVITGVELAESDLYYLEDAIPKPANSVQVQRGENLIARDTAQQIFLGKTLRDSTVRFTAHDPQIDGLAAGSEMDTAFNPGGIPVYHHLLDRDNRRNNRLRNLQADYVVINDLDEFSEQLGQAASHPGATMGIEFYGGNRFPSISIYDRYDMKSEPIEVVKTFSELAGMSDGYKLKEGEARTGKVEREYVDEFDDVKFKRLGVLRMDVDGLGSIFHTAFAGSGTFARYYALSRQFDWFFKGYLNTIWANGTTVSAAGRPYDWKEYIQITYSGGDDLFVVGKWDCVLEFAIKVRQEFREWACAHPGLDISGGLAIVTPKFPLYAAAKQSGDDEDRAKNHFYPLYDRLSEKDRTGQKQQGKQSLTLFGVPLNWEHELELVLRLRQEFHKYYEWMPAKALIQHIQSFEALRDHQRENGLTETWRWRLAYQISRAVERYNLGAGSFFTELAKGVFANRCAYTEAGNWEYDRNSSRDFLTFLSLAARWVEFDYRSFDSEKRKIKAPIVQE